MTDPIPNAATIEKARPFIYLHEHDTQPREFDEDPLTENDIQAGWRQTPLYTEAALRSRSDLREATTAFLAKWDKIEPAINNAFAIAHNHGATYHGPTIEAEIIDLRLALATPITAAGDRG